VASGEWRVGAKTHCRSRMAMTADTSQSSAIAASFQV
jgi:hypothetical protein